MNSISSAEETLARQITGELGVAETDFLAIRARYNDKRAVLKNLSGAEMRYQQLGVSTKPLSIRSPKTAETDGSGMLSTKQ